MELAFVVLTSFIGKLGKAETFYRAGTLISQSHPAVRKWPAHFGPATFPYEKIEQATAAPGERRK